VHFIQHPNTIDSEGAGEVGCLWHIEIFECDLVSEDINNLRTSSPGFGIGLPNLIADNFRHYRTAEVLFWFWVSLADCLALLDLAMASMYC
jgi:hypothetical protein